MKFRAIGIGIQQFEQISLWAFVFLRDCLVLLGKKELGKSLWANVHGQISFAQRTLNLSGAHRKKKTKIKNKPVPAQIDVKVT